MSITRLSRNASFSGWHERYSHYSTSLNCSMNFAIYLPPQAEFGERLPVVYWLSGLTCNEENFMQKAGAQRVAAELGIIIVAPDTSPRGEGIADKNQYDLGQGAGFYLNATQSPWKENYQMNSYIAEELPALIEAHFPADEKRAIAGHSMGGHGALVLSMQYPMRYCSASAFSPICAPASSPWGQKAFSAYLGDDRQEWLKYDASQLMRQAHQTVPTLVDQGRDDEFLVEQLRPEALISAAAVSHYPLILNYHDGYDHSYYFIASFIEQHLRFHYRFLSSSAL